MNLEPGSRFSSPSSSVTAISANILPSAHNDYDVMKRLGKQQVYKRNFGFLATLGFVSISVSTWEIVLVATYSGLLNGGFGGIILQYLWTYAAFSTIVLSIAEMSSMSPTAGGQYHWVSEFAHPSHQKILSYMAGWTSVIAWQPSLAGGVYPVAIMIESLVQIRNPAFAMTRWQTSLLMIGLGFLTVPFNTIWRKALSAFEQVGLVLHFAGFLVTMIILWSLGPKNSVDDVIGTITNSGGWSSTGLSLLVGQVSIFFCMAGFDSAVYLAEEVEDAALNLPKSMVWAFGLNGLMGFVMLLTYLFSIGPLEEALKGSMPFVRVFANTGTAGSTALTVVLMVLLLGENNACTTTESRQLWAFARDRGLPGSEWLSAVHPKWKVPLNSIIVTIAVNVLLCLINLGSEYAFNIIIGIQSVGFLSTYIVSISCLISARLSRRPLPPARWSLGKWGLPINIFAVVYASFMILFTFFPVKVPVTPSNMNWTSMIFVGVVTVSALFYLSHGKDKYEGPAAFIKIAEKDEVEMELLPEDENADSDYSGEG